MAPGALITTYFYESCSPNCLYNSPQDIAANYEEGWSVYGADYATTSLGANIPTNGYDCSWTGDYELTAQLLDAIAVGDVFGTKYLSLWAAGNDRQSSRCGDTYSTMGVPATAKNPIIVGATNSDNRTITWFTSWGPTDDGRLRPDISAPGCQTNSDGGVTSTQPGSGYTTLCGTSMATPAVAGVVALLRTIGFPVFPHPSLIKALLVNTALDLGNAGPDYQFGHGEVQADVLIDHLRDGFLFAQGNADQGVERTYNIEVDALSKLKVTLAWDDVPGELLAVKELVNDLDLTLESPSGQTFLPWILDPASPGTPATRGANRRDNVELAEVDNPESGTWTIHVNGFLVPEGPQSFSIVASAPRAQNTTDAPESNGTVADGIGDLASYPNPFQPETTISFRTDGSAPVDVDIYDASGRIVRNLLSKETRSAGVHFLTWNGSDDSGERLPGGVYFYQVRAGSEQQARKVLMLD
jgi:subtilisin family serine protease